MEFGKVAVMMGGSSAERDVSLKSGAAVFAALRSVGVDAHAFDPSEKSLEALHTEAYRGVFIALHGRGGEDGSLQGALEFLGLPYTGSGVLASALAMDKWRSKLIWQAGGLPVPEYLVLEENSDFESVAGRLGLPLFVKPASEGSSIGITKVKSAADLPAAFALARGYDRCVLAERFMSGGEYTVCIVGGRTLPVIRIEPATEFYDYDAKYLRDDTRYSIPSGLSTAQESRMANLALRAFDALGGRGWGRMDMMLDGKGDIYCLEANTSPGMTDHSLVPMAGRAAGIEFAQLVVQILAQAYLDGSDHAAGGGHG